jgi:hypothetical protein
MQTPSKSCILTCCLICLFCAFNSRFHLLLYTTWKIAVSYAWRHYVWNKHFPQICSYLRKNVNIRQQRYCVMKQITTPEQMCLKFRNQSFVQPWHLGNSCVRLLPYNNFEGRDKWKGQFMSSAN